MSAVAAGVMRNGLVVCANKVVHLKSAVRKKAPNQGRVFQKFYKSITMLPLAAPTVVSRVRRKPPLTAQSSLTSGQRPLEQWAKRAAGVYYLRAPAAVCLHCLARWPLPVLCPDPIQPPDRHDHVYQARFKARRIRKPAPSSESRHRHR